MWTAPHFGLDSGAPDVSALSTNRVLAVPKRLQRACNVPLPEHAEHLKIGGAGEIRTHGADNRTTDANRRGITAGAVRLCIAEHEIYGLSEWLPSHVPFSLRHKVILWTARSSWPFVLFLGLSL
jgi:hypothetical protein